MSTRALDRPLPAFVEVEAGPGIVVARPDRGGLFVLEGPAAEIWRYLGADIRSDGAFADGSWADERGALAPALTAWREAGLLGPAAAPPALPSPARLPDIAGRWLDVRPGTVRIRIRWTDPRLLASLPLILAPCVELGDGAPDGHIDALGVDETAVVTAWPAGHTRKAGVGFARALVLEQLVEHGRPGRSWSALLHAASVARDGRAVVLSGTNGVGKSTLTASLVHAGWQLLSDDLVPLERGSLHAWPVPFAMSVKGGSQALVEGMFPALRNAPEIAFGGRTQRYFDPGPAHRVEPGRGLPVATLVFPTFEPGAKPQVRPVTTLDALGRLTAARCRLPLDAEQLPAFVAWLDRMPRYALTHGGGEPALQAIAELHSTA